MRLVMAVAITGWRATQHPGNSAYILRDTPSTWAALQNVSGLTPAEARLYLRRAYGME